MNTVEPVYVVRHLPSAPSRTSGGMSVPPNAFPRNAPAVGNTQSTPSRQAFAVVSQPNGQAEGMHTAGPVSPGASPGTVGASVDASAAASVGTSAASIPGRGSSRLGSLKPRIELHPAAAHSAIKQ